MINTGGARSLGRTGPLTSQALAGQVEPGDEIVAAIVGLTGWSVNWWWYLLGPVAGTPLLVFLAYPPVGAGPGARGRRGARPV